MLQGRKVELEGDKMSAATTEFEEQRTLLVPHLSTMPSSPRVTLLQHTAVPVSSKPGRPGALGSIQLSKAELHPHTSILTDQIQVGLPRAQLMLSRGVLCIFSCLTSHALHQLKISLEFTSAYRTACNCLCNAVVSLVLKPHFQYWMSTGTWIFPITVSHPAHFP